MKINKKYARERILLPGACIGFIAHVGFPDHEIIIVMTMYDQGCYGVTCEQSFLSGMPFYIFTNSFTWLFNQVVGFFLFLSGHQQTIHSRKSLSIIHEQTIYLTEKPCE